MKVLLVSFGLDLAGLLVVLTSTYSMLHMSLDDPNFAGRQRLTSICGYAGTGLMMLGAVVGYYASFLRRRLARRRQQRLCEGCGYDLRASTERCPECGTRIMSTLEQGG